MTPATGRADSASLMMAEGGLVHVAQDEDELRLRLDQLMELGAAERILPTAPPPLIERLRRFIDAG